MDRSFDFVVVGNNAAALVSALELARGNHETCLINPHSNWGGHFSGIANGQHFFDHGMTFFEFTSFHDPSKDILSYDPKVRNDSGRFFKFTEQYVRQRVDCVEVPTPKVYFNGTYADDFVISNRFQILQKIHPALRVPLQEELEAICASGDRTYHASNKLKNEAAFLEANYEFVAKSNHGQTFHRAFLEPLIDKIIGRDPTDIPALFHRMVWAPLFYGETLFSQFTEHPQQLPTTRFHYPSSGYFGRFIDTLLEEAKDCTKLAIITEAIDTIDSDSGYHIHGHNGASIKPGKLIWSTTMNLLLKAFEGFQDKRQPDQTLISIVLVLMDTSKLLHKFSTLFIIDRDICAYRMTNQTYCGRREDSQSKIVVEFNSDYLRRMGIIDERGLKDHVMELFVKIGLVRSKDDAGVVLQVLAVPWNLPTLTNYHHYMKLSGSVQEKYGTIERLAPSASFAATSLNDQIIQGLKIGKQYG